MKPDKAEATYEDGQTPWSFKGQVRPTAPSPIERRGPEDQLQMPAIGLIVAGSLHVACLYLGVAYSGYLHLPERLYFLGLTIVGIFIVVGGAR